jgi:hypothetical protein
VKTTPTAARFSAHVPLALTCAMLGAVSLKSWSERTGFMGASGSTCEFKAGALAGMRSIIENNLDRTGQPNTGLHIYALRYLQFDPSFASAIRQDESHAQ